MRIRGGSALRRALRDAQNTDAIKEVVALNGTEMTQTAQRLAAVDTGDMKRSIRMEVENNGFQVGVQANMEYDQYVELGTRFQEAQPFIKPAFDEQKEKFIDDLNNLVR